MNKEVTCEVSPTARPLSLLYKQNKDRKRLVHGHFFFFFLTSPQSMLDTAPQLGIEPMPPALGAVLTSGRPGGSSVPHSIVTQSHAELGSFLFPNSRILFCIFKGFLLIFLHVDVTPTELPLLSPDICASSSCSVFHNSSRRKYMSFSWQLLNLCSDYPSSWYNNEPLSKRWSTFIQPLFTEHLLGARHHIRLTRDLYELAPGTDW